MVKERQSSSAAELSTIAAASRAIRAGRCSPVELLSRCLERIDALQPRLNAFITVTATEAMREASTAEAEIRKGRWRGPLHGIPIGVKDFYDTAGVRTTAAFEHFKQRIPKTDAVAVQKLRKAGAIIVGKTNMHRLGMGTTGLESAFGPVRNPWNANFIAGGSSSGSAAAVASGMCYATLDTDAVGSCRLPAACCGVVGFKGSYRLVDLTGILEGEQPPGEEILWLAHAGITARSVRDAALMLDALGKPSRRGRRNSYARDLARHRVLRVGVASNCVAQAEVAEAFARAVKSLRSLGYTTVASPAPLTDWSRGITRIEADRKEGVRQIFESVDAWLLPTLPVTTLSVTDAQANPQSLPASFTLFANYYGLPAVSVPCGTDASGLPLGVQFVGRPQKDAALLALAHRYLQATTGAAVNAPAR